MRGGKKKDKAEDGAGESHGVRRGQPVVLFMSVMDQGQGNNYSPFSFKAEIRFRSRKKSADGAGDRTSRKCENDVEGESANRRLLDGIDVEPPARVTRPHPL